MTAFLASRLWESAQASYLLPCELLAPVQLAMTAGLPYTAIRDLIVTHPAKAEGLMYLFSSKPTM